MIHAVDPRQNRLFDPFQGVIPPTGRRIIADGWQGVFRHVLLEVMPVAQLKRSGRPGQLPTSAPHGSGRAQFRHPALQARNSPVTSRSRPCGAIRRRPVEMGSGLGVPGISPSGGLMAWRLLPSTGSLGSVPPLQRYYSTLRLPIAHPATLRCLRVAVSRSHPPFAPLAAGCAGHGPGVGNPVTPAGMCREGEGASQVPGEPR
jgi:hypothetical protein